MTSNELPFEPGNVLLGKYRVESVLGKGGAGIVLAVRHTELDELFAVKLLLPQSLEDEETVNRFTREARASVRLKGEHVVRVHDVGRLENGAPYMLMECLKGKDLKKVVRERGPLPLDEAIFYMLQTCEAISEAHGIGIIHRDLKPSNLFVTQRPNGTPCIKVLDFGISKQKFGPHSLDLTKTDAILGSPYYMSPEQMARSRDADARSDIWALGVVFYELITGKLPFEGDSLTEIVASVLQDEPVPPGVLRPLLPPQIDAAVLRCLQRKPDLRFQSVAELAQVLTDILALPGVSGAAMADWSSMSSVRMRISTWTGSIPPPPSLLPSPPPAFHPSQLIDSSVSPSPAQNALQEPEAVGGATRSAWGATFQRLLNTRKNRGTRLAVLALITLAVTSFSIAWLILRPSAELELTPHPEEKEAKIEAAAHPPPPIPAAPAESSSAKAPPSVAPSAQAAPKTPAQAPPPVTPAPKPTRTPVLKKKHEGIF